MPSASAKSEARKRPVATMSQNSAVRALERETWERSCPNSSTWMALYTPSKRGSGARWYGRAYAVARTIRYHSGTRPPACRTPSSLRRAKRATQIMCELEVAPWSPQNGGSTVGYGTSTLRVRWCPPWNVFAVPMRASRWEASGRWVPTEVWHRTRRHKAIARMLSGYVESASQRLLRSSLPQLSQCRYRRILG